ncbi:hypothetical protein RN06_3134 [Mycobacterium tuberculosis variant bovis BCG]|nr:hypothetical protein RN06_3134 [Mycobacterium tuberculosis variant bovis BCG]
MLPLHRRDDGQGWASANWRLRRGRIVLLEGDSPAGLRLPLDSISWRPPRASFDADPVAVRSTLPAEPHTDRAVVEDPETAPTTALVAEVRGGLVHIFLPPTDALEHFIDLVARVEAAATTANCPVVIEGYGPPPDPRLTSTTITPTPASSRSTSRPPPLLQNNGNSWKPCINKRAWPDSPPKRSTSTARTAAPAAATTSRLAASHPRTHRCCAGPTCWFHC